jgi:hypothetical protein
MKVDTDDPRYRDKLKITLGLSYDQGAISVIDMIMERSAKGVPVKDIMEEFLALKHKLELDANKVGFDRRKYDERL